jgi:hypothetical protein
MKFSAKTVMKTATFRDLSLGGIQGSLAEYPLAGFIDQNKKYRNQTLTNFATWFFFLAVMGGLCYASWNLYKVSRETKVMPTLRSSLLGDDQGGGGGSEVDNGQTPTSPSPPASPASNAILI